MQEINTGGNSSKNQLVELVNLRMPYGKYKGWYICDIPEHYLVWYKQKGFPKGNLGELMALMFEIQLNGLEYLLKPIKETRSKSFGR
ncbi:MAG: DUF3820 family protein [Bacteroidales bacterium]|nr:DUF3820 family protein [Bacteroidales bacterium]